MASGIAKRLFLAGAIIVIGGLTALYAISPLQSDDFWYLMTASGCTSAIDAIRCVWQESLRHLTFDTGRLANLINAPMLTIIPKWLFALLCMGALIVTLRCSMRLADAPAASFRALLMLCVIVFALPWLDFMFSVVFALNYLWTTALVLLAVKFIILDSGEQAGRYIIAKGVICFIAGWMHEGFSVPLICGLCLYFLTLRKLPRGRRLTLLILFALGTATIALFPAMWQRAATGAHGLARLASWESAASLILFNSLYYPFVIVAIIALLSKTGREQKSRIALLLGATTLSTLLFVLFYGGPRMGWFGQLFSGIGILYCMGLGKFRLPNGLKGVLSAAIVVFIGAHLIYSVMLQLRLNREADDIRRLYAESPAGVVFYDVTPTRIDLSLLKPSLRQFNEPTPMQQFSYYYGPHKPDLVLLPRVLEKPDLTAARPLSDPRLVLYQGMILATDTLVAPRPTVRLVTPDGDIDSRAAATKFVTPDGRPLTLIRPHLLSVNPNVRILDAVLREN